MEREAVLRCQQGDREAFRRVLDFHGDHLYRTALLITRDASRAEVAVQETLIVAWKKIRSFKAGTNLRAWLNRLLINCISNLTSRKRLDQVPEEMEMSMGEETLGAMDAHLLEPTALDESDQARLHAIFESLGPESFRFFVRRVDVLRPLVVGHDALGQIPAGSADDASNRTHSEASLKLTSTRSRLRN